MHDTSSVATSIINIKHSRGFIRELVPAEGKRETMMRRYLDYRFYPWYHELEVRYDFLCEDNGRGLCRGY